MTVAELIQALEELDPDAPIQMLQQPGWPFVFSLRGVADRSELVHLREMDADPNESYEFDEEQNVVYLVEGEQLAYADPIAVLGFENHSC